MRRTTSLEKKLNKNATTILIGGIFLTFSALMYLSFCNMPCEDRTYPAQREDIHSNSFWKGNVLTRKKYSVDLAIIVFSAPQNARQRDLIRETWGSYVQETTLLKFMIGKAALSKDSLDELEREMLLHKDLVLLKAFNDSFHSLTSKLLESFKWIDNNVDCKHVLKVDEDSFVQLDQLTSELSLKPQKRFYWGFFDGRASAKRRGKWAEEDWVLCDRYLPYALGGGYVISSDLVQIIASNSKYLKLYSNEDVSLGTWLSPLDIQRVHDPRFDTEYKSRGCRNVYLITHKQSYMQMRQLSKNLKDTGKLCSQEFQMRNSYIYNWDVLPSHCCVRNNTAIP